MTALLSKRRFGLSCVGELRIHVVYGKKPSSYCSSQGGFPLFSLFPDVDDEYEDEDQWEDGAEDILEKGRADQLRVLISEIRRALEVRINQDLASVQVRHTFSSKFLF